MFCFLFHRQELVDVKREHVVEPLSVVNLYRRKSNLDVLYQKVSLIYEVN